LFDNDKVEVIWDAEVDEILGDAQMGMDSLRIKSTKTGETSVLKADGLFVAIGHDPATDLFKGQLDMDETGYLDTAPNSTATSIAGVYAAGDVADHVYRQAVTAAGMGCMAALECDRFLAASVDAEDEQAVAAQ
jgi:thioredoxin reductase (NADPH)